MNRMKCCLTCFFVFFIHESIAQQLIVKDVIILPKDKTAITNPCLDFNGDTCALVKIIADNLEGLEFPNLQYVKVTFRDGVYEVYLPAMSKKLSFGHKDFLAGQIDFPDFGFKRLKGGKTYLVHIETPVSRGKIILKVHPKNAIVTFDEKKVSTLQTGIYEFAVSSGTYKYSIEALDFVPYHGIVQLGKSEIKTISLSLKPILHSVSIICNVDDASVFIDDIDYGKVGVVKIPQGTHRIRISKDKYMDVEENVTIDATIPILEFTLEKNRNVLEVHPIPIIIKSKSKNIYKNNKEIKGWSNGKAIKFMPGKYLISDENGNGKVIEVIDKTFIVNL